MNGIISYIILAFILFSAIISDVFTNGKKTALFVRAFLVLSFCALAMLRSTNVPDTLHYISSFEKAAVRVQSGGIFKFSGNFEKGYEFLENVAALISVKPRVFLLIIAAFACVLALFAFKGFKYCNMLLALYFSFYGLYFSFIILRAGIAVLFFVCAVRLSKKHFLLALPLLFAGFMFHQSTVAAAAFWAVAVFAKKPIKFKAAAVISLVLFIVYITGISKHIVAALANYIAAIKTDYMFKEKISLHIKHLSVIPFDFSYRFLLTFFSYLIFNFIINGKPEYAKDKTIVYADRLILTGIAFTAFFGDNVLTWRILDFIFVFNVFTFYVIALEAPALAVNRGLPANQSVNRQKILTALIGICFTAANLLFIYRIMFI